MKKYSIGEKIFSIKNERSLFAVYKVICILGIKIKIMIPGIKMQLPPPYIGSCN